MKTPILLLAILLAAFGCQSAGMKYSDYPNKPTLAGTDLFLVAVPGVTNANQTYNQLLAQINGQLNGALISGIVAASTNGFTPAQSNAVVNLLSNYTWSVSNYISGTLIPSVSNTVWGLAGTGSTNYANVADAATSNALKSIVGLIATNFANQVANLASNYLATTIANGASNGAITTARLTTQTGSQVLSNAVTTGIPGTNAATAISILGGTGANVSSNAGVYTITASGTGTVLATGTTPLTNGTAFVATSKAYSSNLIVVAYNSIDNTVSPVGWRSIVAGSGFSVFSANSDDVNLVTWAVIQR